MRLKGLTMDIPKEIVGAFLMASICVFDTGILIINRLLQEERWPAMRLQATSFLVVSIVLSIYLPVIEKRSILPKPQHRKWVLLRGVFGTLSLLFELMAVRVGLPTGDLAALTSINTVLSAVFGRVFLGERLGLAHMAALTCSSAGAVLISKPGPLATSSTPSSQGSNVIGYLLAVASGHATAGLFICARKSTEVSPAHLALGTALISFPVLYLVSLTPAVEDFTLEPAMADPMFMLGIVLVLSLLSLLAVLAVSGASQMCPAVVSATVSTGARMVGGYLSQALLFENTPDAMTMIGAVSLFASVVIVAVARVQVAPGASQEAQHSSAAVQGAADGREHATEEVDSIPEVAPAPPVAAQDSGGDPNSQGGDTVGESLAYFVASEYVEFAPHQHPVRQRRVGTKSAQPGVQMLGASLSGIPVTAA